MNAVQSEFLPVGKQAQEIAGILPSGNDNNLPDAYVDKGLNGVENHWPVVYRQQVLVGDTRQRIKTRSLATGEHNAFHRQASPWCHSLIECPGIAPLTAGQRGKALTRLLSDRRRRI